MRIDVKCCEQLKKKSCTTDRYGERLFNFKCVRKKIEDCVIRIILAGSYGESFVPGVVVDGRDIANFSTSVNVPRALGQKSPFNVGFNDCIPRNEWDQVRNDEWRRCIHQQFSVETTKAVYQDRWRVRWTAEISAECKRTFFGHLIGFLETRTECSSTFLYSAMVKPFEKISASVREYVILNSVQKVTTVDGEYVCS